MDQAGCIYALNSRPDDAVNTEWQLSDAVVHVITCDELRVSRLNIDQNVIVVCRSRIY